MTARVHAFPASRHATMIGVIGHEMAAKGSSIDAAEECLLDFLEIHWNRLAGFGVDGHEIENECRQFARAAWAVFQKSRQETGVA